MFVCVISKYILGCSSDFKIYFGVFECDLEMYLGNYGDFLVCFVLVLAMVCLFTCVLL